MECASSEVRATHPYRTEGWAGSRNGAPERSQSWRQMRERWNLQGRTMGSRRRQPPRGTFPTPRDPQCSRLAQKRSHWRWEPQRYRIILPVPTFPLSETLHCFLLPRHSGPKSWAKHFSDPKSGLKSLSSCYILPHLSHLGRCLSPFIHQVLLGLHELVYAIPSAWRAPPFQFLLIKTLFIFQSLHQMLPPLQSLP